MMYGFGYVWTNQVMQSVNWFLHVFKKRITDCWKQRLDDRIHKRDRYSVYSIFTLEHCVATVVVCSLTNIQEASGKRSNHLLVSLSAIAQDKNKGNQNTVS